MDDRLARLEGSLASLTQRFRELEARLAALESASGRSSTAPGEAATVGAVPDTSTPPIIATTLDSTAVLAVLGRTLLVLGGAFFLRALTDSGTLRPALGVGLGLVYALTWMLLADRAGRSGRVLSAGFHGIAFVLIALPLVVEATSRFHLLNPTWSAAALLGLATLALSVAARRRALALAWVTTLGALLAAVGLAFLTGRIAPYAVVLVALGGIALWFGYVLDWFLLRWPAALAADLAVLTLGVRSVTEGVSDTPAAALFVQILFLSTYLGSIAARTLFLNRDVVPFEVIQSVATIAIGLGGAAHVTRASGAGGTALGVAALVLGVGCYAVAVAFVERRQGRRNNFYFYTSAALVFTLVGCGLLVGRGPLALAWVAFALVAMLAGRWSGRVTFHAHGAIYATAAAIASGLVLNEAHGLGLPVKAALEPSGVRLAVLAACGAGVLLLAPGRRWQPGNALQRLPRLVLLVIAVGGIVGVIAAAATPVVIRLAGDEVGPGAMATVRTALLVVATLLLAWAARSRHFVEGAWLVYPLLVLTGIKFVLHDLRVSRPVTLFLAFALYGTALILAPRLRRPAMPKRSEPGP